MINMRLTICSILLHSLFQTSLATTVTTDNDIFFDSYLKSEKALILLQDVSSATTNKLHTLRKFFLSWKKDHNVSYETFEEELSRMLTWTRNHEFITEHNSKTPKPSFTLGHNSFSDKSNDEFQRMNVLGKYSLGKDFFSLSVQETKKLHEFMPHFEREDLFSIQKELRHLRNLSEKQGMERSDVDYFDDLFDDDFLPAQDDHAATDDGNMDDDDTGDLPDEIDWVEAGAVTPVKNQGRCGSCWAFSSTGAIEGAHFILTGELVALSEQNIMDCDKVDHSCEGGLMENAFQFEETQKGLCTESDYPYLAMDESICMTNCTKVSGTHVTGYTDLSPGDKHSLIASIVTQPTSIAMDAGNLSFQFYSGGVFDDDSCGADGSIDHGVLAVGYGFDEASGHKFFKIKNSWGESWGDGGFFKIKRDSKNEFGTCAILAYMTAPVVS